jgi:large subunit ribosomal protein L21
VAGLCALSQTVLYWPVVCVGFDERFYVMYAVVRTGGKQYRVAADELVKVDRMPGTAGDSIVLNDVLLIGQGAEVKAGAGQTVDALIVDQIKADKIVVFKKKRRHNYRRKQGHRQQLTLLRITAIGGVAAPKKPAKAAATPATALDASNLSLISGVGPTIEKKLRAAGITSWNDIAAWTDADIARWDEELKLRGRATREEWVEQAKELLDGKPPRAKADQAEAASGEDQ